MRDCAAAVDSLCKLRSLRATARGTASDSVSSTTVTRYIDEGSYWAESTLVKDETITVRCGSLYDTTLKSTNDKLGVSPKDAVRFAWEILPWSFVVDWFSNAGDFLSAHTNALTQNRLAEWVSIARELNYTRSDTGYGDDTGIWVTDKIPDGVETANFKLFQRTPLNLGSRIGFHLDLSLDRTNVGAAIALTLQQLTRR
jgi:hypothetical protein